MVNAATSDSSADNAPTWGYDGAWARINAVAPYGGPGTFERAARDAEIACLVARTHGCASIPAPTSWRRWLAGLAAAESHTLAAGR